MDDQTNAELIGEFVAETREHLEILRRDVAEIDAVPNAQHLLTNVFRSFHTIKGNSGFFGFVKLGELSHSAENVLSKLQDGTIVPDATSVRMLSDAVDVVGEMLDSIQRGGGDGSVDAAAILARLAAFERGVSLPDAAQVTQTASPAEAASAAETPGAPPAPGVGALLKGAGAGSAQKGRMQGPPLGRILLDMNAVRPEDLLSALEQQARGDKRRLGEILVGNRAIEPGDLEEALRVQKRQVTGVMGTSVRVDVSVLNELMSLVGELVVARGQLHRMADRLRDSELAKLTQRVHVVTRDLHTRVMNTRMQRVGSMWARLGRVARELAESCGKKIDLTFDGGDTEIDKAILEGIRDPMTHLIRNAIDHGIETPEDRLKSGKSAAGRLSLGAFHESGLVSIEIRDDGKGIDVERVRQRAIEKGVITTDQAVRMSEADFIDLIFRPGFSTAKEVTNLSGRGVGMDVVKTNIERIGGSIDVQTVLGEGSVFRLRIPLTLAIIPVLTVQCGGQPFALPYVCIKEIVRIDPRRASTTTIYAVDGTKVLHLRGKLLPLVALDEELGIPRVNGARVRDAQVGAPLELHGSDAMSVVVLDVNGTQIGLLVDEIGDTQEIVVKPLGTLLRTLGFFSGTAVLADGSIALVLDALQLVERAKRLAEEDDSISSLGSWMAPSFEEDRENGYLLFSVEGHPRMALPLTRVVRLEDVSPSTVEWGSGGEVIQYRGAILPLLHVDRVLGSSALVSNGGGPRGFSVVMCEVEGAGVGLIVEKVIDIVHDGSVDFSSGSDEAMVTTTVIQKKVTEVLNLGQAIEEDKRARNERRGRGEA